MMPCCVPSCINLLQEWTTGLPRDEYLLARWRAAILAGTGQSLPDETVRNGGAVICSAHFMVEPRNRYREPTLFIRNDVLIQVSSCRLCLQYDRVTRMYDNESCLVKNYSLLAMANTYYRTSHGNKANIGIGLFCESCTVHLDITHSFWQKVYNKSVEQKTLLRKMDSQIIMFQNTGPRAVQVIEVAGGQKPNKFQITEATDGDVIEIQSGTSEVKADRKAGEQQQTHQPEGQETIAETVVVPAIDVSQYKCNICCTVLESMEALSQHLDMIHKTNEYCNRPFKCDYCSVRFLWEFNKKDHMIRKHGRRRALQKRKQLFKKPAGTGRTGKTKRSGARTYCCKPCSVTFDTLREFKRHLNTCVHDPPFHCEVCDEKFAFHTQLINHRKMHKKPSQPHDGDKSLKVATCKVCHATFNQTQDILDHFKKDHPQDNLRTYTCPDCFEVFVDPNALRTHRLSHKEAFACDQCDHVAHSKGELSDHLHTVHGAAPETERCPICHREFKVKHNNLGRHMKTHTAEKLFTCQWCDKDFREHRQLLIHQRFHTGEKPLLCSKCGERFATPSMVFRHKKKCSGNQGSSS